jgi:hypothetical protein
MEQQRRHSWQIEMKDRNEARANARRKFLGKMRSLKQSSFGRTGGNADAWPIAPGAT